MNDSIQHINMTISMCNIPEDNVVNVDETNVLFSINSNNTCTETNSKTMSCKQASASKRATTLLGVSLKEEKLLPFLMFKAVRTGRILVRKKL